MIRCYSARLKGNWMRKKGEKAVRWMIVVKRAWSFRGLRVKRREREGPSTLFTKRAGRKRSFASVANQRTRGPKRQTEFRFCYRKYVVKYLKTRKSALKISEIVIFYNYTFFLKSNIVFQFFYDPTRFRGRALDTSVRRFVTAWGGKERRVLDVRRDRGWHAWMRLYKEQPVIWYKWAVISRSFGILRGYERRERERESGGREGRKRERSEGGWLWRKTPQIGNIQPRARYYICVTDQSRWLESDFLYCADF